MYYAVVNIPAGALSCDQEPLGPNIKGPLMHRQISETGVKHAWKPGYFLLKYFNSLNFYLCYTNS